MQSIAIESRGETGSLVPVSEDWNWFYFRVSKIFWLGKCTRAFTINCTCHNTHDITDNGALAVIIGQVALPWARKFIVSSEKRIGRELLVQAETDSIDR